MIIFSSLTSGLGKFFRGDIVKQDERYIVQDFTGLKNLVVSQTILHPGMQTSGHKHEGQEEVYFFISGKGTIQLDETFIAVREGDVVPISDGVFHKVSNSWSKDLIFRCVFDGRRYEG